MGLSSTKCSCDELLKNPSEMVPSSKISDSKTFSPTMTLQRIRATSSVKNPYESSREAQTMPVRLKTKRETELVDFGAKYTGEWLGDKREGMGLQIWADGSQFLGTKVICFDF
jgi:hypothetical protein